VIVREVDRLDRTVEQLLDLARPMKSEMAAINIEDVVERALAVVRPQLKEAGVNVEKIMAAPPGQIRADSAQLTQVFLNLFLNALQAMPDGGTLTIEAERSLSISRRRPAPTLRP